MISLLTHSIEGYTPPPVIVLVIAVDNAGCPVPANREIVITWRKSKWKRMGEQVQEDPVAVAGYTESDTMVLIGGRRGRVKEARSATFG